MFPFSVVNVSEKQSMKERKITSKNQNKQKAKVFNHHKLISSRFNLLSHK